MRAEGGGGGYIQRSRAGTGLGDVAPGTPQMGRGAAGRGYAQQAHTSVYVVLAPDAS